MDREFADTSFAGDRSTQVVPVAGRSASPESSGATAGSVVADESVLRRLLTEGPYWLLLVVLVYAPWAYGCTRAWSLQILNWALFAVVALWLLGAFVTRSRLRVHPLLLGMTALILLHGWWMTLNAGFSYDAAFNPHPRSPWAPALPGAVDYTAALPAMTGLTALLGAMCLACHMAESRLWRKRIAVTLALTGCSVIALGLAQKLSHAPGIFWSAEGHAPTFFATYRYHANAGSFINIVWPLTAAILATSLRRQDPLVLRIAWSVGFVVTLAGALANTSRASGLIAVMLFGVWILWLACRLARRRAESVDPAAFLGVALLLAAVVNGVIAVGGLDATWQRWGQINKEMNFDNSRLMVSRVCLDMLPQSGWFGFGPGTFKTAFPFFNKDTSNATRGVWLQAHQDYLQTLVEWGWIGAMWWAVALVGGIAIAAWAASLRRFSVRDRFLQIGASAAIVAVLLHSLGDFPLQVASLQLYVGVLVGVLWSAPQWETRTSGEASQVPKSSRSRIRSSILKRRRFRRPAEAVGISFREVGS